MKITEAVERVERLALSFQGVIELAALVKELGPLEQSKIDLENAAQAARDSVAASKRELEAIEARGAEAIKRASEQADGIVNNAKALAKSTTDEALKKANKTVKDAREQAESITKKAADEAKAVVSNARSQAADIEKETATLKTKRDDAQTSLAEVEQALTARRAELGEIEESIKQVKAAAAKLAG